MKSLFSSWHRPLALGALLAACGTAAAQEARTYTRKGSYEDVRFELNAAIIAKGLKIEQTGDVAGMLERTGPDVGSTKPVYSKAEFMTFCSAVLSRRAMEADPANIASCPYVVFVYEAAGRPGEVVAGYRRPIAGTGTSASRETQAAIEALLDGIVREAIR